MTRKLLTLSVLLVFSVLVRANSPTDSTEIYQKIIDHFKDSVNKSLNYTTGKVKLEEDKVQLDVPEGFKFLNKQQSKYVLNKLWGNPESATSEVIGMIFRKDTDPFSDSSYAFVVSYSEIGYVKDEDADKINYDELLKSIQEEEKEANEERVKAGYPTVHIVGWAQKPFYDKDRKILHWAKEIQFGNDSEAHTLNYDIRILGRKGLVSLNAVGKMYDLPLVNKDITKVLSIASFTEGNSYFDFNPKIDNVAAWTIGGLVAGKLLAKAGLFALIAKFLAPLWKVILAFFIGIGAWFRRKMGRKKDDMDPGPGSDETVAALPAADAGGTAVEATVTEGAAVETTAGGVEGNVEATGHEDTGSGVPPALPGAEERGAH